MKNRIYRTLVLTLATVVSVGCFSGCNTNTSTQNSDSPIQTDDNNNDDDNNPADDDSDDNTEKATNSANLDSLEELTDKDRLTDYDEADVTTITLSKNSISADSDSVSIDGNIATITKMGDYIITGAIDDGQIVVDSDKETDVHIIMDNASITSKTSAPLYVKSADKVIVTLKDGTENYLSDSSDFKYEDTVEEEPNATLFSKDSLTINGTGSLTINAEFNNGIQSKDHLKILSGNITVTSANDAIKGKDSVTIAGGNITITTNGDGLDSSNAEEANCGYIHIADGNISIDCREKGIKAVSLIYIESGTIDITSTDDALNCNSNIQIDNGTITIDTKGDAIHADLNLIINDGDIDILNCYEGLESESIFVNEGVVNISATDDGINVASANSDSSEWNNQNPFASDSNCVLTINGGYVYINCEGDGLDSNGTIIMNDGIAIIEGPSFSANGALDYGISFIVNGGYLIAMGASGMAENISDSSTQCGALLNFQGDLKDVTVSITDSRNNIIASYTASKTWSSITVSTPELTIGETYNIFVDGELSDATNIGSTAFVGGTLIDGTSLGTFTQDSLIYGSGMGGGPGGSGMGGPGGWR